MNAIRRRLTMAAALCLAASAAVATVRAQDAPPPQHAAAPRVSVERHGAIPTRDALELTFTADRGSVHVFDDATGEVRYHVTIEAVSSDPSAKAQLHQIAIKARGTSRGITLDGKIAPQSTAAGLQAMWVSYELHVPHRYNLRLSTQAGDIVVPDIDGQIVLHTGGGNIQAGKIGDFAATSATAQQPATAVSPDEITARLETAGGRISVGDIAGTLSAETGGGHITTGDIFGDAMLRTGGGHIHVGHIAGAAHLSTGGGNIYIAGAESTLDAETGGGHIELGNAAGAVQTRTGPGERALRLEAGAGNEQSRLLARRPAEFASASRTVRPQHRDNATIASTASAPLAPSAHNLNGMALASSESLDMSSSSRLAELSRRMEALWWGGVRVDPAEQQQRLVLAPPPDYPEAARRAGIEGQVTLLLRIGTDGTVQDASLLSGEPILGRAAAEAVEQWRYQPVRIDGQPVNILTSVTLAFQLR